MTEKEVQDIFAEELAGKPTEEALMSAYDRIAVQILANLAGPSVNDETWGLLKDTAHAKSRLCLIDMDACGIVPDASENALREVLYLFEQLQRVIHFFNENYDSLDSDKFKKEWPQKEIIGLENDVARKSEKFKRQFAAAKTLFLGPRDLYFLNESFTWAWQAILGTELFKQFQEEFNQTLALLKKYKTELLSPSA